jgi:hypothetical protein
METSWGIANVSWSLCFVVSCMHVLHWQLSRSQIFGMVFPPTTILLLSTTMRIWELDSFSFVRVWSSCDLGTCSFSFLYAVLNPVGASLAEVLDAAAVDWKRA